MGLERPFVGSPGERPCLEVTSFKFCEARVWCVTGPARRGTGWHGRCRGLAFTREGVGPFAGMAVSQGQLEDSARFIAVRYPPAGMGGAGSGEGKREAGAGRGTGMRFERRW